MKGNNNTPRKDPYRLDGQVRLWKPWHNPFAKQVKRGRDNTIACYGVTIVGVTTMRGFLVGALCGHSGKKSLLSPGNIGSLPKI